MVEEGFGAVETLPRCWMAWAVTAIWPLIFLTGETGVLPSPCFPNFLARTTFVLESLPEAKNPGQDAVFGDFVVILEITAYLIIDCDYW